MIMLTVTKPRRKLKRLLKGGALLLLLGVIVPGIHHGLEAVGAMSLFASGETVTQTEQAAQVETGEQAAQVETGEQAAQAEAGEQAAQAEAGEQAAQAEPGEQAAQAETGEQAAQAESGEQVAQAETGEQAAQAETGEQAAPEDAPAEKPGLWQRLRAVIFGEKAEVIPY